MVLVGIAAAIMPSRRAQLFRHSPADWRLWGVPVLPVAGIGCVVVGLFAIVEAIYFHAQLGLKDLGFTIALPFIFIVVGFIWYWIAQALAAWQGSRSGPGLQGDSAGLGQAGGVRAWRLATALQDEPRNR